MKNLHTINTNFAKRLAMTMMVLMTISIGNVLANTYTWTLNSGDLSAGSSSVTKGLPQTTWQTTYTWTTSQTYFGYDTQLGRGLQIGSADKSCQKAVFTTNGISGTINSITINSSGNANATINVTIGGESVISSNLTTSATDYTSGAINKSGTIEITLSNNGEKKALYMKSIVIEYTPDGSSTPTPEPDYPYVATLVTDASDLSVDDKIIIVAKNTDFALSTTQNTNNRGQATVKKKNNLVYFNDDAQLITLEEGTVDKTFAFNVGNDYLYAASSSSNHLKTQSTKSDNGSWSISISSEGVATIKAKGTNTRNWVQHNSSSSIFSCYSSSQQSVAIYKYESCSNSVSVAEGTMTNVSAITFSAESIKTCADTDAERQVTISITPESCYTVPNNTRLTISGTNATYINGPTADGNGNYTFVYQFAKDATGITYISASLDTPKTYTINYNKGANGQGEDASDTKICDVDLTLKGAIFTRLGYNQIGWSTIDGGNKEYELGGTYTANAQTTLYPVWEKKDLTNFRTLCTYEIILDKNGGTTDGSALVTASKTALTAINPPVYADHQIAGYYAERECNTLVADVEGNLQPNTPYTNANGGWTAGEVTLYPKWEALEYTVTWKVGDELFATSTVSATQPLALPAPAPTDGVIGCCAEKFIGWSTSTTPTKVQVFNDASSAPAITGDQTFHAVFATPVPGAGNSLVTFNEMGYANEEPVASVTLGDGMGNGDATITFAKGTAATYAPTYYNIGEAVRTYAGNTITVEATYANTVLTQIDFTFAKGENANAITASTGTITDGVWTGNEQSVTFTIDGATGHRRIASIAITTAVTGDPYTNYVTKCDLSGSASIGAGTITYANSATAIDTKCGQRSPASKAAMLTFASAQDLTCPVTIEASAGFLVSTNKNDNSKYASSITVKPVKTGANKGKLPTVYVRAEANFGASGQINGTITVTGSEITETTINVLANVTCTQYTLTVVNHLGETISTAEYYEGVEVAKVDTPATDDCSKDYTFDGWSTDEVTYGSLAYNKVSFPLTMPAENVKLYPVYECNKTADYHRVTYDLGAENWEGDYVIAYYSTLTSELIVANGKEGGVAEGGIGYANNVGNLSVENDIISKSRGNQYYVTLEAHNTGYLLKTQDGKYNYHTTNSSTDLTSTVNASTAAKYLMYVNYSVDDIQLCLSGAAEGSKFRYYLNNGKTYFRFCKPDAGHPIRLYKKSPLYTTPLICGTIEAEDAVVTSTAGQTIKVNVPITITSTLGGTTHITAESDNDHFTVTPLENVSEGEHAIAVHYTPTATTDGTETANITLTASHGNRATTTFQVTGRHLPENFVIAAKWGENWYVLPADMTSESITEGLLIEVNEPSDPTKALAAPNTTKYGLKSVYTSNSTADRYADNGEKFVFVENITGNHKTLYNGGGDAQNSTNTNIQVYAQYKTETGGYYETNPERYEWIPTTTNLKDYTLTSVHAFASEAARTVSLDNHGVFGTLLQDKSYNGMVRLLPVDDFYEPIELQVVEWKQNSVSVMYTGAGTKYTTQVGNNAESSVQTLSAIDHAVYELTTSDLTTATNQPLIISIKDNANATIGVIKLTIPAIVATDKNSTALGVTEENAKATSIVVLDGATLTADATKYTYDDITVYPGGNLIIDDVKSLGMYTLTLRAGSSWGAEEYEHKYPQFLLRGDYSNTSAQINLDYVTTQDYYYPLSVPEEVTIGDIKYPVDIYGNNVKKANTGSFQLKYYDGAQRATGATGWVVLDEKNITKLSPNSGYAFWGIPKKVSVNGAAGVRQTYGIHRIPIKIAADKLLDHEKINEEIAIQAYAAARPNDQGWNYLGNPYLAGLGGMNGSDEDLLIGLLEKEIVDGQWTGGWVYNEESVNNKVRYITITNDCQNFEALPVANAKISPFTTFFIQAASVDDQKICLTVPASVLNVSSLPARHYAAQQEAAKEITTGILLTGNDQTDRTGLLIADNFTEEYDFNADLSKFENSGINLYTIGKTGYLAYMAINQALAEQPISVGYTAPAEGLYTIAFDEDRYNATDISALYLIDYESNEKTNLLLTDYSFVTAAGTNNQRFALQVAFVPANSTNVEWVGDATIQVGVEGTALIINNLPTDAAVHVFDALGRLMYHIPHAPIEMQLTLPTGYYLVRIADKQNAVVTNIVIP